MGCGRDRENLSEPSWPGLVLFLGVFFLLISLFLPFCLFALKPPSFISRLSCIAHGILPGSDSLALLWILGDLEEWGETGRRYLGVKMPFLESPLVIPHLLCPFRSSGEVPETNIENIPRSGVPAGAAGTSWGWEGDPDSDRRRAGQ